MRGLKALIIMMNNDALVDGDGDDENARRSANGSIISAQEFGVDHNFRNQSTVVTQAEKRPHQS